MKINCNEIITGLDGSPLKYNDDIGVHELTVGTVLSNILISSSTGGKMKMTVLAQKFYSDDEVMLDDADFGMIREIVNSSSAYQNNLVPGKLLIYLDSLK